MEGNSLFGFWICWVEFDGWWGSFSSSQISSNTCLTLSDIFYPFLSLQMKRKRRFSELGCLLLVEKGKSKSLNWVFRYWEGKREKNLIWVLWERVVGGRNVDLSGVL